jgi:hypothetical protein
VPEENHVMLLNAEFFPLCCTIESAGLLESAAHDNRLNEVWALLNFLVQKFTRTVLCETVGFVVSDGSSSIGHSNCSTAAHNGCCVAVAAPQEVSIFNTNSKCHSIRSKLAAVILD